MIGPPLVRARVFGSNSARLPGQLAGPRVERVDEIVGAGVDDEVAPHRDRAIGLVVDAFGQLAPVVPDHVAALHVEGHDVIAGVRHVDHAVVHDRRPFLAARSGQPVRPDHPQLCDVVAIDLRQGAVAPSVQRATPHQPVGGVGLLQHRVGDGYEPARHLLGADGDAPRQYEGSQHYRDQSLHDELLREDRWIKGPYLLMSGRLKRQPSADRFRHRFPAMEIPAGTIIQRRSSGIRQIAWSKIARTVRNQPPSSYT